MARQLVSDEVFMSIWFSFELEPIPDLPAKYDNISPTVIH
jgi:hypothetical protein